MVHIIKYLEIKLLFYYYMIFY